MVLISGGVPFGCTHLPSGPSPHRLHVVTFFNSGMDFDLFDITRSRPLSLFLQNLLDVVACCSFSLVSRSPIVASSSVCHRLRTAGRVRQDFPGPSLTQIPRRRKGCESYHQRCLFCHGFGLLVHDGLRELPLSVTTRLSGGSLSSQQTVQCTLR